MDYSEILKRIESSTSVLANESLKVPAFDRLLEHELASLIVKPQTKKQSPPTPTPKAKARRLGTSLKIGIREEVKNAQLGPVVDGLPGWGTLGVIEKYLWIIAAARRGKIDGLTSGEIKFLIFEIFRENHDTDQIKNLKTKIKDGWVQLFSTTTTHGKLNVWRILKNGDEHLDSLRQRKVSAQ